MLPGRIPRRRMSSENPIIPSQRATFGRVVYVSLSCRRTSSSSITSSSTARRSVIRATFQRAASSRSGGSAAPSGNVSIRLSSNARIPAAFPGSEACIAPGLQLLEHSGTP
ncbi:hypothetical protein GCM10009630_02000 [Kribbella jejuensis]